MNSKINFFLLVFLSLIITTTHAQDEFGGHPRGQNWQILTSNAVRVIYPSGMDENAQRVAQIINHMNENNRRSIGDKKRRIDIVLQNRTVNPNGYVALAPYRSEFFSTPPQSNLLLGSIGWLDGLAIHEYRHAQQVMNHRRGLTKLFSFLQGESLWAALEAISVPNWYSEGDAVIAETALTTGGRGRAPFFSMEQRALALADKNYGYIKHRNGSFRSLLPDHYRLGYMMLTKTRNDFGNDITQKIAALGASYRYLIYPFSRAMKKLTGYGTNAMYNLAWQEKKQEWANQLKNTTMIPTLTVTEKTKQTVTDYRYPRFLEDGSIIARKSSYKKTDALVLLKNGDETEISTIGFTNDEYLSIGGGKIAWAELSRNARRGYLDYSNIIVFDKNEGKRKQLTHNSRYFSPTFSQDGKKLAAIHISFNQENSIVLLDPETGEEIERIKNPFNYFLSRIAWTPDGNNIITIAKHENKLALIKIEISTGNITELTPWSNHTIESPSVGRNRVFFNTSYSGIDNIFSTDLEGSKQVQQITSVPIGAFEPDVSKDDKTLIFTEFTEMGYLISKQNIESKPDQPFTIVEPAMMKQYETVANKTEGGDILGKISDGSSYLTKPFRGLFTGQKLYSWNVSPSISAPSLSINTANLLNDVKMSVGATLNRNEGNTTTYQAEIDIARFGPIISLNASNGGRQTDFYSAADTMALQSFNETLLGASMAIPLQWLKGNYITSFSPKIGINFRNMTGREVEKRQLANEMLTGLDASVGFSTRRRKAYQNVGTRLGFSVNLGVNYVLDGQNNTRTFADASLFLPGIGANHAIQLKGAYQRELLSNIYQYADTFEYPRGYEAPINDEATLISANYHFPIAYPDFGIRGLFYIKRVRANIFYDSGIAKNIKLNQTQNLNSTGLELVFDTKLFHLAEFAIGIRNAILLNQNNKTSFGVFMNTSF